VQKKNTTPVEAALHLCEVSKESVERSKLALAEIQETIERLHATRRRTDQLFSRLRRASDDANPR
jgi:hypothetical protein